jgi:hypothetical protein
MQCRDTKAFSLCDSFIAHHLIGLYKEVSYYKRVNLAAGVKRRKIIMTARNVSLEN